MHDTAPRTAEASTLREISPQQWRSGIAAWLGWMFDGLDIHLYTLVALPFVAELLSAGSDKPIAAGDQVTGYYGSIIQAAFMLGWALGGGFFGRIGDRMGRSRALVLTILTYAIFTGAAFFAQTWWHLMICRFLAALGIGGEWAVGASLLAETWPTRWRPWIAAVLQSAVNCGILLAMVAGLLLADLPNRCIFLVGILPALIVVWIRRAVPEPVEWEAARAAGSAKAPRIIDLFGGSIRRTTLLTTLVCALSLSAHWAFMFWFIQHFRQLLRTADWASAAQTRCVGGAMILVMVTSILGNFLCAAIARKIGYRRTISAVFAIYFVVVALAYCQPRDATTLVGYFAVIGLCQGSFALFTMYLPPLFPTLLRTTGAGFCYNIGRVAAAAATIFFGLFSQVGDYRLALFYSSFLFIPAAIVALFLPE